MHHSTFALLIIAFRIAYAFGQSLSGRFLDRIGLRRGLPLAVAFYSLSAMATTFSTGLASLAACRFLLGAGESANWPGAAKAVAEWFPRRETGWAVAIYDSGSAVGGAIAPLLVYSVYHFFNDWRPAFFLTGGLGLLWIPLFRWLYHPPETHPRLSPAERADILENRADPAPPGAPPLPYSTLLRLPQTWGIILSKSFTDPVWYLITDWFASRGWAPRRHQLEMLSAAESAAARKATMDRFLALAGIKSLVLFSVLLRSKGAMSGRRLSGRFGDNS